MIKTNCKNCGKEFLVKPSVLKRGSGKYCSMKCSKTGIHHPAYEGGKKEVICRVCGKTFKAQPSFVKNGLSKYCSKKCFGISESGDKHNQWLGGRTKIGGGYILIYSPTHPFCNKGGYVFEHRLVMETFLGRILLPTEVVHHINGIVDNNRIENLMLFSNGGTHTKYHFSMKRGEMK